MSYENYEPQLQRKCLYCVVVYYNYVREKNYIEILEMDTSKFVELELVVLEGKGVATAAASDLLLDDPSEETAQAVIDANTVGGEASEQS